MSLVQKDNQLLFPERGSDRQESEVFARPCAVEEVHIDDDFVIQVVG